MNSSLIIYWVLVRSSIIIIISFLFLKYIFTPDLLMLSMFLPVAGHRPPSASHFAYVGTPDWRVSLITPEIFIVWLMQPALYHLFMLNLWAISTTLVLCCIILHLKFYLLEILQALPFLQLIQSWPELSVSMSRLHIPICRIH